VVGLAGPLICAARLLAARAISEILGSAIQTAAASAGPPDYHYRDSPVDQTNGDCESTLACATIHGELKMLGIPSSERTVSRILRRVPRPPSQTWRTFLHNHLGQTVSTDFFTVSTITMKVLFVFIVLEHRRRQVLHFNVTEHPTAAWTAQQDRGSLRRSGASSIRIRDRDSIYGNDVRRRIASLGMKEVLTAPQSPWQNPYAASLIGSIRRECLNHRDQEWHASEDHIDEVFRLLP
jgi:transposase InsO family protein